MDRENKLAIKPKRKLFSKIVIIHTISFAIITLIIIVSYILGSKSINEKTKDAILESKETSIKEKVSPLATPTTKTDKGLSYANLELSLIDKNNAVGYPQSLMFAIKMGNFHPDWVCDSLGYDEGGFSVYCQQKTCSIRKDIKWPSTLTHDQQRICLSELENREYPPYFKSLTIRAQEYEADDEIVDSSKVISQDKLKKTKKGIFYEFNKTTTAKYNSSYSIVFYSPFELTNRLSKMGGTFYGADWIYAKYTIRAEISGDNIDENKAINLFESVIDSITFIQPNND